MPERARGYLGLLSAVLAFSIILTAISPSACAAPTQIKVSTNRFVINDDPMVTIVVSGCINGADVSWTSVGTNYWSGEKVRIRAYALVMNESGFPQVGENVTFNLTYPNGSTLAVGYNLTDSFGAANFSYYMNNLGENTNGTYTITASTGSISSSTAFTYTFMGCKNCHGDPGDKIYTASDWIRTNSTPYSGNTSNFMEPMHIDGLGKTMHTNTIQNGQCTYCHTLYGYPTPATDITGGPAENPGGVFPWGVHNNLTGTGVTCWTCHLGARTVGAFPEAPDCFGSRCHSGNATVRHNTNLTNYTTWNANKQSVYSFNSTNVSLVSTWTMTPLKAHKGTRNVPCIICHGPTHNITKPGLSPSQAENATYSNSGTEDTFCQWCHTNISAGGDKTRHNGQVPCTICHSQDIHNISFATNSGGAYTQNRSQAVDCRGCHQGNWTTILATSKVGYTGPAAPQIPTPLNHSDNNTGQRWGQYWGDFPAENGTQAVAAESVTNGTTTGVSGAQTADGLFERLTEALITVAQNVSTYVTAISFYNGSAANFANMQNGTDGGAFANLSEEATIGYVLATSDYVVNGNFSALTGQAATNWAYTETDPSGDLLNFTGGAGNTIAGGSGARGYVINSSAEVRNEIAVGRINQSFVAPDNITGITSRFAWNASIGDIVSPGNYYVKMYLNYMNGTLVDTLYRSANLTTLTQTWAFYTNSSITTTLTAGTRYNLYVEITFDASSNGRLRNGIDVHFDDVLLNITAYQTPPIFALNATTNITGIPTNYENYTLQIRANTSGSEAFNVTVQNSTGDYNYKGQISGAAMGQYNFSLTKATELQSGVVWVRLIDANRSENTARDSLYVDFERVYANTSDATNYRLDVVQNITGVPLAKDAYNLTIKGNISSGGENFDLYVYNFDTGQFVLKNATTFSATNVWHNFTLSSSEISSGGVVSIQWVDSNQSGDSGTQSNLTLDFVGVYYQKGATVGSLSCHYCHGNTKHNASALGRVAVAYKGTNYINGTINSTSFWCGACHYPSNPYYTNMTNRLLIDTGSIPPDNTNYSTAQGGFNHSDTLAASSSDDVCKGCHGGLVKGNYMTEFKHNVQVGQACTGCHFSFSTMNGTYSRPAKFLNESMFKASVHGALDCLNCHTATSNASASHPGANPSAFMPPEYGWKWCEACHEVQPVDGNLEPVITPPQNKTGRHNLTTSPNATSYNVSGALKSALEITDCTVCHNSTVYNDAKATFNRSIGKDCRYCHTLPDKTPGSP
ncbi:MAG: hypothetical protein HY555_03670 [Euryarchaeota archaeon]|nr:hypothetical protein [Euryarchaeota archaeon]